jgi:penicillin-binding protein 1A
VNPPPGADRRRPFSPQRRRRRRRRRAQAKRRRAWIFGALVLPAIIIPIVLVVSGFGAVAAFRGSCTLSSLKPAANEQNSFVYAADGSLLGAIQAERNRQPVSFRDISRWMAQGTVAIEDRRFWQHGGVDYEGIARALWKNLQAGEIVEGGSTITQQLVRNLYISREQTYERKIKEACLAIKLSRNWSKRRILTAYMNYVFYGNHAYGVEAAAQTYFSKKSSQLNLLDAALLAGLPQAPSRYDPFANPRAALTRRNAVLRAMYADGVITQGQYELAVAQRSLFLKPGKLYTEIREPYFFGYVRDELIRAYGANTVHSGGLRVYTTIVPSFQRAARKAIKDTLYYSDDPAAALVSINPANGAIRAMAAVTPGRRGNQFNIAAQARRQPGSTAKVFVLTAAVEMGMDPFSTTYVSAPFHYQPNPSVPAWDVSTYSHGYSGPISVASATLSSDNTVYAQLTLDVGPQNVARMARRLGVRSPMEVVPSIGLGSNAVSPLDMASAYATIAAGGIYSKPTAIRRVVLASGRVDTDAGWGEPDRRRVISDGVAYVVQRILEQNIYGGTGTGAYFGRTAAGKTGTTDDHSDAWFVGWVPQLETAVWVGYPQAEIPMDSVHGISVAGGTFPAEIWRRYMSSVLRYSPEQSWTEPKNYPEFRYWRRGEFAIPIPTTKDCTFTTPTSTTTTTIPIGDDCSTVSVSTRATTTVEPSTSAATTTVAPPPATTTTEPAAPTTTVAPPPAATTTEPAAPTTTAAPPPATTTEPAAPTTTAPPPPTTTAPPPTTPTPP